MYICVTLQGSGKTILVSRFAAVLGYNVEPIVMYQVSNATLHVLY